MIRRDVITQKMCDLQLQREQCEIFETYIKSFESCDKEKGGKD